MNKTTIASVSVMLASTILLSSCATILKGTKETIYVRSNLPHTTFYANERELGTGTSAIVTIPKKKLGKTILRAEKQGCHSKTTSIETSFDATTLLGLFWDCGIISIVCVDWLGTGAVTKADQTEYILTPEPITQEN